jgi:phasin family protein
MAENGQRTDIGVSSSKPRVSTQASLKSPASTIPPTKAVAPPKSPVPTVKPSVAPVSAGGKSTEKAAPEKARVTTFVAPPKPVVPAKSLPVAPPPVVVTTPVVAAKPLVVTEPAVTLPEPVLVAPPAAQAEPPVAEIVSAPSVGAPTVDVPTPDEAPEPVAAAPAVPLPVLPEAEPALAAPVANEPIPAAVPTLEPESASKFQQKIKEYAMTTTEEFVSLGQANVEAVIKSGQIWTTGVQDITKTIAESAQAQFDHTVATWKALAGTKSLKEAFDIQSTRTRAALEKAVADTGKVTDASIKLAEQAMAPITARLNVAAEKFSKPTTLTVN